MKRYVIAVLIGWDVFSNAILGGVEYQTLSCRIGLSIQDGGWASHIPWPQAFLTHFARAVHEEIV